MPLEPTKKNPTPPRKPMFFFLTDEITHYETLFTPPQQQSTTENQEGGKSRDPASVKGCSLPSFCLEILHQVWYVIIVIIRGAGPLLVLLDSLV